MEDNLKKMITSNQKNEIVALIEREKSVLGSYSKVANKCSVAVATITNNILKSENWALVNDAMWTRVGKSLGFSFTENQWQVVETTNYKMMRSVLDLAQSESMFIAVSERAGSGKTASISKYNKDDETNSVFVMQCEEWSRRTFLIKLSQVLGLDLSFKGYLSVDTISSKIISSFKQRAANGKPLLVLDEADKLKHSALRWLIHFYNKLEDEVGCVIAGTENLRKEIKSGVARAVKGFDELDSRLGRNFVTLYGCTKSDFIQICTANGLTDANKIDKAWKEAEPREKLNASGRYEHFAEDLRRVKRIIKRELKFSSLNAQSLLGIE